MPSDPPPPELPLEAAYRAPAGASLHAGSDAVTGATLLLVDTALVPIMLSVVAFGLPFFVTAAAALNALPWIKILLIVGALARTVGAIWLVRAPEAQPIGRRLRIAIVAAAGAVLLTTAVSVLLKLGDPTVLVRGMASLANQVGGKLARPAVTVMIAHACGTLLGAGKHRWLVGTTMGATLAWVGLQLVDIAEPFLFGAPSDDSVRFSLTLGIVSSVIGFISWVAASVLLWRLRAHLRREPNMAPPMTRSPP